MLRPTVVWRLPATLSLLGLALFPGTSAGQAGSGVSAGGGGLLQSFSLSADRGPVEIESATLEFEYRTGLLVYKGGVEVSQADLTLSTEELRISLDIEQGGRPSMIVALGDVKIVAGERIATGARAEFDDAKQTVTLSGDAVLRDGPNEVSGDKVVVFLEEERSVVEGGDDRVRAVLFPAGVTPGDKESGGESGMAHVP